MQLVILAAAAVATATAAPLAPAKCKPLITGQLVGAGGGTFNVSQFVHGGVDGKWYVHAQQPISYLPKDEIYCVTAEYTQTSATAVDVHNYANHDRVNGKVSDSGGTLQAVIKDAASPAKLAVGPKFLPHLLYGPYWVVAYAPTAHPPWAVIAGGQPTQGSPARSLCAAGEYSLFGACRKKVAGPAGPPPEQLCADGEGINHSGLWVFGASPVMAPALLEQIVSDYVVGSGIDPSVLLHVNQTGCTYSPK